MSARAPLPLDPAALKDHARALALAEGFDAFGVAEPDAVGRPASACGPGCRAALWRHGWMAETVTGGSMPAPCGGGAQGGDAGAELRSGPGSRAILARRSHGAISVYAQGEDYHDLIKAKLKRVARGLLAAAGGGDVKVFVDTAPLMEKPLAWRRGWAGRARHQSGVTGARLLAVSRRHRHHLDLTADPPAGDHCGACRACLDACPTAAFPAPYQLDARRCISYLTIEHKGPIPRDLRPLMGNRIYGCDDCLAACPWNKFAVLGQEASSPPARQSRAGAGGSW